MANNHSTLTGLFTDIADAIREKIGDTGDTLTWDGNTEGLVMTEEGPMGFLFKVSDAAPSKDDLINGLTYCFSNGQTGEYSIEDVFDLNNAITLRGNIYFVFENEVDTEDGSFPEKGTYVYRDEVYFSSLTIPGYTGFSSKIVADQFPEVIANINTQEDLDSELTTQDDLIEQITTTLSRKIPENLRDELDTQDDLIAQIAAALEGKVGNSESSLKCFASFINGMIDLEDINGNIIFDNHEGIDIENFDLSEYVGELVIMHSYASSDIYMEINDYGVSFPLLETDITTYALYDTYAFVVPNHDIVLTFSEAM